MNRRNRILYVSPYFWPEEIGSAPYSYELAQYLSTAGYDMDVISFRPHYPSVEGFEEWSKGQRDFETHQQLKIERVPVAERGAGGFVGRLINDIRISLRICKLAFSPGVRDTKAIVTYIPSVLTLFGAKLVQLRTKAPIVTIVHDIESGLANALKMTSSKLLVKLMRFTEKMGLNFCDEVIVLTEGMKQHLLDIGCESPITVLPIWSGYWEEGTSRENCSIDIMYSGNFGKKQNLEQLIPLFNYLKENSPNTRVLLRGQGSERSRIEGLVSENKLDNVSFADLVSASQLVDSLQSAELHLVPQAINVANYALPSKLITIMAAGRPFVCIAEKCSPLEQLSKDSGAGICVYPGEKNRLNEVVSELLSDKERLRSMGERGRNYVKNNFDKESILKAYSRIIEDRAIN